MIGVDEAGLGPVIGSMFVCSVKTDDSKRLPDGIKDSKKLSKEEIYDLAQKIYDDDNIQVCVIEVDSETFDSVENNNDLLKKHHSMAIDAVSTGCENVLVDACSEEEQEYLEKDFKDSNMNIRASFKADEEFSIVGAASIIAKYSREQHISKINSNFKDEIGSGYPNDKSTLDFLAKYYEQHNKFPSFVRKSWKTCSKIKSN